MPITGATEHEYLNFLEHGGDLTFYGITARDIDASGSFEEHPNIKPYLTSGFELAPSNPMIDDPLTRAPLLLYGGSWTRVVVSAYANSGRIIYKRGADGLYEANVSAPLR